MFLQEDVFGDDEEIIGTKQPVIIAVGENRSSISQYKIKIEDEFLFIDGKEPFESVFLTFYACFHVFGLHYDYALTCFMALFDTYIFKVEKNTNYSNVVGTYNSIMAKIKTLNHD